MTASELNGILGVSGAIVGNESAYRAAIAANDPALSSPATSAEVQAMVTAVNNAASLLANIGTDAANGNNNNTSALTASELNGIPGVNSAVTLYESNYRIAIAANDPTLSSPATAAEVQAMILSVNRGVVFIEIYEDSKGGSGNANEIHTSFEQINSIGLTGVIQNNFDGYLTRIWADENFSNPPTVAEVQAVIDDVNNNVYNDVTSTSGRIWLDRNLGATRVATSRTDAKAFGFLYQWGRNSDGHQSQLSSHTLGPVASGSEGSIYIYNSTSPKDWLSTKDDTRWNGTTKGTHDPCPSGYRVPTEAEWITEISEYSISNYDDAFDSFLKLPSAGFRSNTNRVIMLTGERAYYWTSSVSSDKGRIFYANPTLSNFYSDARAAGYSVRCIKQ